MTVSSFTRIKMLKCISRLSRQKDANFMKSLCDIVENKFYHTSPGNKSWNVLFFGSDNFSVENLKGLNKEYRTRKLINCLEVVTLSQNSAVWDYATSNGLEVCTWPPVSNGNFDFGVVVSFGRLIPSDMIHSFPLGMINVHASLLPRWRGAAPIIYALKNGDTLTGISIMKIMPKKFDVGGILMQEEVSIDPDEKMPELHEKLAKKGSQVLVETIKQFPEILDRAKPQSNENVTCAPKVTQSISYVNWKEMSGKNVYDLQRAIFGMYDLRTKFGDKVVKLFDIEVVTDWERSVREVPGFVVYSKKHDSLLVKCQDNSWISVKRILIAGKSTISAVDFYNGFLNNQRINHCFFES